MSNDNMEEDYPSNTKSKREKSSLRTEIIQPKKVTKVIEGRAIRQKKTLTQSIASTFLGDDTRSVGQYILFDVLIPAAKNTIQEMITTGIEMLLFGETRGSGRSRRDKDRSTVSYGNYYKKHDRDDEPRARSSRLRDRFDLDEIVFRRGDEASDVLEQLCELLEDYDQVTVADYFELAGVEGASWAHQKWGWENLSKAYCTHTRGGYAIVLPKPIELD